MTRALVLGGGGPVGIAWEAGLIAGLAEGGVELAEADFILGTSAGSFVGSQLAMGRKAADMAARHPRRGRAASARRAVASRPATAAASGRPRRTSVPLMQMMQRGRRRRRAIRRRCAGDRRLRAGGQDHRRGDLHQELRPPARASRRRTLARRRATPAPRSTPRPARSWSGTPTARSAWPARWPPAAACPASIRRSPSTAAATSTAACARAPTPTSPRATSWWCWSALRTGGATPRRRSARRRVLDARDQGADRRRRRGRADHARRRQPVAAFGANLMDARVRPAAAQAGLEQGRALAAAAEGGVGETGVPPPSWGGWPSEARRVGKFNAPTATRDVG